MIECNQIRISLIGDIFPGELAYTQGYGIKSQFNKNEGVPWVSKIREIIGDKDIVIGNLESPLVEEDKTIKDTFFGNPKFASFLKDCGINVLNIANNHILEQGACGFESTINALKNANLNVIGNIENNKSKIVIKEINGFKIAIVGFSNVDLHKIKNNDHFAILNEDNVINALQEMNEYRADLKILCFHWGNEFVHIPSLEQRKMAYKFIDHGADIITGHHPHVIQPYEKYKDGHIFYSLGNFMFDYIHSKMFSIGLVATIEIDEKKQIDVILKGVKLSYKNTVMLLSQTIFENYYLNFEKTFAEFKTLSDFEYQNRYHTLLKRNHLCQRITMKTSIIYEFIRIKKRDKLFLFKNFSTYHFNLLKRLLNR